ncbi:putative uncharacterized protein DDB_G0282133 [Lucilia cuprina]|uniref:putative uncharacterized protein DDB_G0282133 n=1 Tax=Lucilia cuprina TaxID=7375 RepID=UPI001F05251E|nr:putative uncharacterized protein DDB_G0282133 [Lucilia cuprina]
MFGLLNTTQIYGIQQHPQPETQHQLNDTLATIPTQTNISQTLQRSQATQHRRSNSSLNDNGNRFFASITSKNPTNFIEKFLKTDLLSTYDNIKNYRNYSNNTNNNHNNKRYSDPLYTDNSSKLTSFNCLHDSYRHSFDGEFYDRVKVNNHHNITNNSNKVSFNEDLPKTAEMTIKCSKNLLAVETVEQGPATLQNYQKIPESEHDLLVDSLVASSGASSGEFNSSSDATTTTTTNGNSSSSSNSISSSLSSSNLYKRLSFGGRNSQNTPKQEKNGECNAQAQQQQQQDGVTDNSITLNLSSSIIPCLKVVDLQRSSSSTSSSGDFLSKRERKKGAMTPQPEKTPLANLLSPSSTSSDTHHSHSSTPISAEKAQRRKLLQMLSSYDQQNKFLQRELAKEKRRRTEELACVVKSLLCFESKLKTDMKSVNQRLQEKDVEICRLVRQNRALSKKLTKLQEEARASAQDEGVVEDGDNEDDENDDDGNKETKDLLEDCLVLEALQCINCRKQFYDIEVTDNCTQTGVGSSSLKDTNGSRNNDDPTTEHGSSSDDTVSSSFFGARRSVRYTSKRTSGTFRDYMRSRAMNIDDPALEADNNSEEYPSTISRDDSQTSYEKLNIYSRTMERMHGVKSESERDSEQSGLETTSSSVTRSNSRASTKSSKSTISTATSKASEMSQNLEEDDGIFSPTQDEDFEEEIEGKLKIVRGRAMEAFSEASPKQIYETSTDDWYASASDQEEIPGSVGAKSYGHGAVNPVLECVNQILLQQSMEGVEERSQTPKNSTTLPRRSSLSDRRNQRSNSRASDGATPNSRNGTLTRKRVHFSTKNSMVHVPRNDETEDDEEDVASELKTPNMISNYQGMTAYITHSPATLDTSNQSERLEIFNYESIYSNEYEPIGSELNSSNLYVDMDSNNKTGSSATETNGKSNKLPPALPPKPANLLKFKKSLQQLDESPDELIEAHNTEVLLEPDYCSISEVNVGITSVQIRADIHRAPLSERDLESVIEQDNDLDTATVVSEAASQKTEEIEEIFADIPKLPNVAAIIAPKSSLKQNDYLIMTPKVEPTKMSIMGLMPNATSSPNAALTLHTTSSGNKPDRNSLKLNLTPINGTLNQSLKSNKVDTSLLRPQISSANYQQQYKRKHMPNILQEINKRLSLPNSPLTPTSTPKSVLYSKSPNDNETLTSLPLQAEFDWYNLDAEYGKNTQSDMTKVNETLNTVMPTLLADIKEDGESLINTADEYNLDEEYSNEIEHEQENDETKNSNKLYIDSESLCEAINPTTNKAKKIRKNLANFEKFIENTSLTSKPLPTKRKIYFAGPFV